MRCNAPLTVLILPLLTPSQRDRFPSLRRFATPGALTHLPVRFPDPLMEAAKAPATASEAGRFTLASIERSEPCSTMH
jgi:hypothetical protein